MPGGAILRGVVDGSRAALDRLVELGATGFWPVTPPGQGLVTASVVDPFAYLLGVMTNPHWSERV